LQNLIASSDIATIFVDRTMRVKRYTPSATSVFNLIGADVRPLALRHHAPARLSRACQRRRRDLPVTAPDRAGSGEHGRALVPRPPVAVPHGGRPHRRRGADADRHHRATGAEDEARAGQERLRLAAQTTNDYAIIVQDPEGVIQSWNAGAERVFGYAEADAIGRSIELIFTAEDRVAEVPARERETALRDGRADDERWHVAKSGRRVFCSGVVTPLSDPKFTGFAKIARDLTTARRSRTCGSCSCRRNVRCASARRPRTASRTISSRCFRMN